MHVAGVTFPGVPGIVLGHNENIAWGATNVGPDVQDLYYETFNAEGKYKTPAGWSDPVVRHEMIKVRTDRSFSLDRGHYIRRNRNSQWPDHCRRRRPQIRIEMDRT